MNAILTKPVEYLGRTYLPGTMGRVVLTVCDMSDGPQYHVVSVDGQDVRVSADCADLVAWHFALIGDAVTIHGQSDPAPYPLTRRSIVSEIERVTALGWPGTAARYRAMLAFLDAHFGAAAESPLT